MNEHIKTIILQSTGATEIVGEQIIQELWSGYGHIVRVALHGAEINSLIVKHIKVTEDSTHPRGWNTNLGHERKMKSYQVETNFYQTYSSKSPARLPECLAVEQHEDEVLILLEDLDEAGFPLRKRKISIDDITSCLKWLAQFHAGFLGTIPDGLWKMGTYWHLETRPQELEALNDPLLKKAAALIDSKLNHCTYQTLVHGDAKLANFCFSEVGKVAGVDFQYVGGGCGMKDIAYFIGSCLSEQECERLETQILDTYFGFLHVALGERHQALEEEWRPLYRVAWADFHRFLKGWSPRHWKINSYSERVTQEVINNL